MLKEQIEKDLLHARKNKQELKKKTLMVLKSQLINTEIALRAPLTDTDEITVIRREIKQIEASIDGAKKANRDDLLSEYQAQLALISGYLPTVKTAEETEFIMVGHGVTSNMSMKDIMTIVRGLNDNTIDNRIASAVAKSIINN